MTRLSTTKLLTLGSDLSERDRQIVMAVGAFGAMSARQLQALFFPESDLRQARRLARRTLLRLSDQGLLHRLERRVGGVRAGSAGHVYRIGPAGRRLVAYWRGEGWPRGRRPHEPGSHYLRHQLAVAGLYVDLVAAERAGRCELLDFDPEPACWRELPTVWGRALLKPDAYVRVAAGAYEERCFIEVDLGTVGVSALRRQAEAYVRYWRSGVELAEFAVHPRTLWLVSSAERLGTLRRALRRLPAEAGRLFALGQLDQAADLLVAGFEDLPSGLIGGEA